MLRETLANSTGQEVREAIREGRWTRTTHGVAYGYIQANLAIVPEKYAFDFMRFCHRNPKPCPIIDVTNPGDPEARYAAPGSDLRTDLSGYRIYRNGDFVSEVDNIRDQWKPDHVAFLLGCSLSFDAVMIEGGVPLRHLAEEQGRVSVYVSGIECEPAGDFKGPMVVSMRPIPKKLVARAVEITSRHPLVHGAPVHIGDSRDIGIPDPTKVNWGKYNAPADDEVGVYWACGITPQAVAMAAKIPEMITHSAGCMFVTDMKVAAHQI